MLAGDFVELRDCATGALVRELHGSSEGFFRVSTDPFECVAAAALPSDELVVAAATRNHLHLWELGPVGSLTRVLLTTQGSGYRPLALAFAGGDEGTPTLICVTSGRVLRVWCGPRYTPQHSVQLGPEQPLSAVYSVACFGRVPSGRQVVVMGGRAVQLQAWCVESGAEVGHAVPRGRVPEPHALTCGRSSAGGRRLCGRHGGGVGRGHWGHSA